MNPNIAKAKNIIIDHLRNQYGVQGDPYTAFSIAYETLSGLTLSSETDVSNGEDYIYKCDADSTATSIGLHPEVVVYFNLGSRRLDSVDNGLYSLYCANISGEAMAEHLEQCFDDYLSDGEFDMLYTLTATELGEVVNKLLTNDSAGALDELTQYTGFIEKIGQVISEYCGGDVHSVESNGTISFASNDSLPCLVDNVYNIV
jgi:hypothetical protein